MTDRPNRTALIEALDIYRDAMRQFIVRSLRRVPRRSVEDCIKSALLDSQYNQFEQNLRDGRDVGDAIDIGEFPQLVKNYWHEAFRDAFKPDFKPLDALHSVADLRNEVAHPASKDMDLDYAGDRLRDISNVLTAINEPEKSRDVEDIRDSIMPFATPAHRFRQGGRDVYAFTLDIEILDKLLPDRVDDRMVKDANRPLTPSHARNIQKYLEERDDWLLGTLLLGISPDALEFRSYMEEPNEHSDVGELRIHVTDAAAMKMFDGQHRRRAIKDTLAELSHGARHSPKLTALKSDSLPIMLYAEGNIKALRQMFADAARTRTIERNTVTIFDQRDAFNLAALEIANESELFAGRVEMERSSVPRSSHNIIAINQLAMTLKTLEVGYSGRVSRDRNISYMLELDSLIERCWTWADDFMPTAREEYNNLMAGEIDNSDIPQERAQTMAYNATVIRILAGCYYEWLKQCPDWDPLAEFLQGVSLRPGVTKGSLLVDAGVVAPGGISPGAQTRTVVKAIDYIVEKAQEIN